MTDMDLPDGLVRCPACGLPASWLDDANVEETPFWVCDGPNDNTDQRGCHVQFTAKVTPPLIEGETKIVKVSVDLHDAWQVWQARVPSHFTERQVQEMYESGELDVSLFDSGYSSETITNVAMEF